MGLVVDFIAAMGSKDGFRIGWKRARHIRHGHLYSNSKLLDKLRSENHPHTDGEYIYTVNVMRCLDCGLTYNDAGLATAHKGELKLQKKHAVIAFMGGAKNAMGQEDHAKGTRFIATRQPAIVTKKMRQLRKYSPEQKRGAMNGFYLVGRGRRWRVDCHGDFECSCPTEYFDRWANSRGAQRPEVSQTQAHFLTALHPFAITLI